MINPEGKPNEKESVKPANRYSYPQLAFKLPALAPGQNSIGTGGQYSIGADTSTLCEFSFVDEMRTEGDANGCVTPATKHLGFTLIHDRMVSETFFQRALADIGENVFDYGPVLSATDIFSAHFLESLNATEKEILMPVVLQLVARGDFPLHIWDIVGDDQVATRVA